MTHSSCTARNSEYMNFLPLNVLMCHEIHSWFGSYMTSIGLFEILYAGRKYNWLEIQWNLWIIFTLIGDVRQQCHQLDIVSQKNDQEKQRRSQFCFVVGTPTQLVTRPTRMRGHASFNLITVLRGKCSCPLGFCYRQVLPVLGQLGNTFWKQTMLREPVLRSKVLCSVLLLV